MLVNNRINGESAISAQRRRSAPYSIQGRSGPKEFWAYLGIALVAAGFAAATFIGLEDSAILKTLSSALFIAAGFFLLTAIIRRLHDFGFSGLLLLCLPLLIPAWGVNILVAFAFLIIFGTVHGEPRDNCYGEDILGRHMPPPPKRRFSALHFHSMYDKATAWLLLGLGSLAAICAYSWTERSHSYWGSDSNPYRIFAVPILIATLVWAVTYIVTGVFAHSQVALAQKIDKIRSPTTAAEPQSFWLLIAGWYFRIFAVLTALTGVYLPAIVNHLDGEDSAKFAAIVVGFPFLLLVAWLLEGCAEFFFCQSWCVANCPSPDACNTESSFDREGDIGNQREDAPPADSPENPAGSSPTSNASLTITMIPIPGKDYMISALPVTQNLWFSVMGENPSHFHGADYPVVNVSYDDCQNFLEKLNARPKVKETGMIYRLPTAEEWEFACRAGAKGDYCKLADGSEITKDTLEEVAWYSANSDGKTHPVGQKKPNAFGLYDMLGNVWEWAVDINSNRVLFGGSRGSFAEGCESTSCFRNYSSLNEDIIGFRLAADIVK